MGNKQLCGGQEPEKTVKMKAKFILQKKIRSTEVSVLQGDYQNGEFPLMVIASTAPQEFPALKRILQGNPKKQFQQSIYHNGVVKVGDVIIMDLDNYKLIALKLPHYNHHEDLFRIYTLFHDWQISKFIFTSLKLLDQQSSSVTFIDMVQVQQLPKQQNAQLLFRAILNFINSSELLKLKTINVLSLQLQIVNIYAYELQKIHEESLNEKEYYEGNEKFLQFVNAWLDIMHSYQFTLSRKRDHHTQSDELLIQIIIIVMQNADLIRGGCRGGHDQFQWESLRTMKYHDREQYLGQTTVVGYLDKGGKWRKKDWYTRKEDREVDDTSRNIYHVELQDELKKIKEEDEKRIRIHLGLEQPEEKKMQSTLTKEEVQELTKKTKVDFDEELEFKGLGGSTKFNANNTNIATNVLEAYGEQEEYKIKKETGSLDKKIKKPKSHKKEQKEKKVKNEKKDKQEKKDKKEKHSKKHH